MTIVKRKEKTLFVFIETEEVLILGRKRKPDYLKKSNLILRLPNPVIWELAESGNASREAERIILEAVKVDMNKYEMEEESKINE